MLYCLVDSFLSNSDTVFGGLLFYFSRISAFSNYCSYPKDIIGKIFSSTSCCSVTKLCLAFCNPMDCSTPGFSVFYYLPEFAQTHFCGVDDTIQPSHPLLFPSLPALNLSQHPGLFQWVSTSHQVAKILELQHQSSPWISRVDFL